VKAASRKDGTIVVGGPARIDLLPPEVHNRQRNRATRRRMLFLVAVVAVATAGGVAFSVFQAASAQARLSQEQDRSQALLAQQLEFQEVTSLTREVSAINDAREIGASTEILWQDYIQAVSATVPEGAAITILSVKSSSPITGVPQPMVPLQAPRVATLGITLAAPDLPTVSSWMAKLPELPGFADATLSTIAQADSGFVASITLNVGVDAFANRFIQEG
jgi:Tfp pilus assembly protein PilN